MVSGNRMREEEDCLYWPVKYSSNEAGAGREVRQEMERSPQGNEHHSSGDTRERGKSEADQRVRKHMRERTSFYCVGAGFIIPHEIDGNSPHNSAVEEVYNMSSINAAGEMESDEGFLEILNSII